MTTHVPYSREPKPEGWTKPRPPGYYQRAAEAQRKRRRDNPEKYRLINKISERKRKIKSYGITQEEYLQLFISQGHVCGICKTNPLSGRDWHIDHDHKTGKVRGLLCHHCNLMLGNAKDSINTLKEAIKYLEKSNA